MVPHEGGLEGGGIFHRLQDDGKEEALLWAKRPLLFFGDQVVDYVVPIHRQEFLCHYSSFLLRSFTLPTLMFFQAFSLQ